MREVADDGFDFGGLQRSALDLGANSIEAFRRSAGLTVTSVPDRFGKAPERRLGKAEFIGADQARPRP